MCDGRYSIELNRNSKVMYLMVAGTFNNEKVAEFIRDYNSNVASVVASEFVLEIDVTDMKVLTQDMIPQMQACHQLYRESGFKKVVFVTNGSALVQSQMARVARMADLKNVEFTQMATK
ncbi:hypothetical protein [Paenibacillus pabuli]|uniref:hypothetical protein n=1 Tax=Paenibacillus pabuli TaxID=1472 RepID=UPI0032427275